MNQCSGMLPEEVMATFQAADQYVVSGRTKLIIVPATLIKLFFLSRARHLGIAF
jgi:hypothetical protein